MRPLTSTWQQVLRDPSRRLVMLVTISPTGLNPSDSTHLALDPASIRCASDTGVHPESSAIGPVPFWPTLMASPTIERRLSLRERRFEVSEITLSIASGAELIDALEDAGGGHRATVRIDLWSDGVALEDVILLAAGPVRDVPIVNPDTGSVQLIITDGFPDSRIDFPAGPFTAEELPDAPPTVLARAQHRAILGAFQQPLELQQIDRAGQVFYLCSHELEADPSTIARNGVPIDGWRTVLTATSYGRRMTTIVFTEPVGVLAGGIVTESITAAGGMGIIGKHPLLILLEDVCGLPVTPRARQYFEADPFGLEVLAEIAGNALELVRRQLVPQLPVAFGFSGGECDVIPLGAAIAALDCRLGAGIRYRLQEQPADTPLDAIANEIIVSCGRASAGGARIIIRRTPDTATGTLRDRLTQSKARYGRRSLAVEAWDLPLLEMPGSEDPVCPAGEVLADVMAATQALPASPRTYAFERLEGMVLELGDAVDVPEFSDQRQRVVGWVYRPEGPIITLEDDPWG